MRGYPIPSREVERLEALRAYQILDSAPEQAYDDLVEIASVICETPMALITLIDDHRQWFKARRGLAVESTPREHAFCAHAIVDTQLLVVPDAHEDARFVSNPFVAGEPNIRFYAGAPLVTPDGHSLGTICVIDSVPREPTSLQLSALQALSRLVVEQLELRRAAAQLASALQRERTLVGLLPICAYCKSIRDGQEYWSSVEQYLRDRAPVEFTHGICPKCEAQHFPKPDAPDAPDAPNAAP